MADLTTLRYELSVLQSKPRTAQVITAIYNLQKRIAAEEAKLKIPPSVKIDLPAGAAVESQQKESNILLGDLKDTSTGNATAEKQDEGNAFLSSIDSKVLTDTQLRAAPLDVTGTITVDTSLLATANNQTDGSQKSQIVDSSGNSVTVTGNKLDVNAAIDTSVLATSANQATEIAGLAAILAKLSSDPATQTTLAAILAKLIAAPSTEAKQDTELTQLTNLNAKDFATQTTLAALLAKVIAAPSTEAKQDVIITSLSNIDAGTAAALGQALMAASVPVVIASNQSAIPISGTVSVDTSLLATSAKQDSEISELTDINTKLAGTLEVDTGLTQPLTDIQLRAADVKITLDGETVPVTGTFWQATQPVSAASLPLPTGASTEAKQDSLLAELQLKADLTETQPVSLASVPLPTGASTSALQTTGNTSLASIDAKLTNPLPVSISSDIEIGAVELKNGTDDTRATVTAANALKVDGSAVTQPVSGTVTANTGLSQPLTDTELRATPVPVSGTVTATPSGTQNVDVTANTIGLSTSAKQDAQTALLTTIDGDTGNISTKIDTIAGAVSGTEMQVDVLTMPTTTVQATNLDIRDLTFAADKVDASGSVLGAGTNNIGDVDVLTLPSIPAGNNNIGDVDIASIAAGDNNIGNVDIVTMPAITGTVTANAGTNLNTSALNLEATQADIKTSVQLIDDAIYTDGAGTVTKGIAILGQDGTNPHAIKTDASGELQVDVLTLPNVTIGAAIPAGNNNIGDVDVASVTGNVTVVQGTGTNLHTVVDSGTITTVSTVTSVTAIANALPAGNNNIGDVDVATLPAIPTGTNTIGSVKLTDGTDVALVTAAGEQNVLESNSAAIKASVEAIDDAIATYGTSTYTEATTRGTLIAAVRRDANTTLVDNTNEAAPLQVNSTGDLKVAQILPLPAGTNLMGKVGIDQTTPGTTNKVSLGSDTINTQEVKKATYRASTTAVLVPAVTSPNPWFTFYGSATKTIRIQSIIASGLTLTAVAYLNIGLRKYSTAVSGGTSTSLTQVPVDANNAAGTATNVNVYTAIPTAGTTVGDLTSRRVLGQATTAAAAGIPQVIDFDFSPTGDGTSVILRGTAQGIGLYWITAPATTVSMLLRIEWTEET